MKNNTSTPPKDSAPNVPEARLCNRPAHTLASNYQYHQGADCFVASKGYLKVDRRIKEHRRMRHSLNLAKEVQQNLLPKDRPDFSGLDIAG